MAEVVLDDVTKTFGATTALDDVSHDRPERRLRRAARADRRRQDHDAAPGLRARARPTAATSLSAAARWPGCTPAQRNVAMVFQQYSLYPHMTVRENLAFPLRSPLLRTPRDEIARKVAEVAEVLRISHKLDNKATALSGGEMQRVVDRPGAGARPRDLPDGRAAELARRQAPAPTCAIELKRIQANTRRDAALRHPRPDRGDDHGDPCRRARRGPAGAVRHAARDLRESGQRSTPRAGSASRGSTSCPPTSSPAHRPGGARSACGPSTSARARARPARSRRVEHLGDQTRLHLAFRGHELVTLTDAHTALRAAATPSENPAARRRSTSTPAGAAHRLRKTR